jgi:hypothetical protein
MFVKNHPIKKFLPFTNKKVTSQSLSIYCYKNHKVYELLNKQFIYFMLMENVD